MDIFMFSMLMLLTTPTVLVAGVWVSKKLDVYLELGFWGEVKKEDN